MEMQSSAARLESDGIAEHGRVRYAKPSEWTAQKDIIRRLYLDENKTLDEVRRIMADKHQFHATPSMYKKRIRVWHFSKKLEEDDVLEVLQQKLERKAAGETSHNLVIRGRVVRNQRLRRFLERRPEVLNRLQVNPDLLVSIGSPSSSYGVPTTVPRVRSLSPESRNMEMTLSAVRDYVRECAGGPNAPWTWASGAYTSRRREAMDLRSSRADMFQAVDEFYCLQASIDGDRPPKEVFQLLNSTLNRLSGAIKMELPDLVFQMLEILQHPWSNHPELSRIFRRHVADLGVVHLGINHPLSILWIHMLREHDRNSVRLSHDILELLLQELLISMGPHHHLTCVALDYVLRFLMHTQDAHVSWKRFHRWLTAYPEWQEPQKWAESVRAKLQDSGDEDSGRSKVILNHRVGDGRLLMSPAMEYQRGAASEDLHSRHLLPYLSGRIAIRNGDAERAEGWFLIAKAAAKEIRPPHLIIYYLNSFTNLHVLYSATNQEEKLAGMHKELQVFKAELPVGFELMPSLLPPRCPDCAELR
ncbi:Clr5 domain-containing protein [Nemania sp. NC0429]|nr:Clr5 domain-containing protein [Nemania sp. NC0429]